MGGDDISIKSKVTFTHLAVVIESFVITEQPWRILLMQKFCFYENIRKSRCIAQFLKNFKNIDKVLLCHQNQKRYFWVDWFATMKLIDWQTLLHLIQNENQKYINELWGLHIKIPWNTVRSFLSILNCVDDLTLVQSLGKRSFVFESIKVYIITHKDLSLIAISSLRSASFCLAPDIFVSVFHLFVFINFILKWTRLAKKMIQVYK